MPVHLVAEYVRPGGAGDVHNLAQHAAGYERAGGVVGIAQADELRTGRDKMCIRDSLKVVWGQGYKMEARK